MPDFEKAAQHRHDYMTCLKLARETDSKKEDAYLREEAKKALVELRKVCPHQHAVVLQSYYSGCSSMDYDDKNPEHRICLCCGEDERSYDDTFKILTVRPFARFEGKYPDQIKKPLCYLLTDAIEIAEKEGYPYFGFRR
jgi:hypothetical protein